MRDVLPGILHWTTFHDGIGARVSSHYVEPAGALIDQLADAALRMMHRNMRAEVRAAADCVL
jgi:hypothetical protein